MNKTRFWFVWNNSLVKFTLERDASINLFTKEPTEEGWCSLTSKLSYDGVHIIHDWETDGVDCDGRLRRFGRETAKADYRVPGEQGGPAIPDWQTVREEQRDYAAERAGY